MGETPKSNKAELSSGIGTLLLGALGVYVSHHTTSTGEVAFPKQLLIDTAVVVGLSVVWLASWLLVYRNRDSNRDRIKFARENGRKICQCTELGEIMVFRPRKGIGDEFFDAMVCPKCDCWAIPDESHFR